MFALFAGLVLFAVSASAGNHTTPVPTEPVAAEGTVAKTETGAVDMNNWQETQTLGNSSKFRSARR
jgi:hypothetical protein